MCITLRKSRAPPCGHTSLLSQRHACISWFNSLQTQNYFCYFFFFHFHTTATTPGDMRCVTLWCGRWYSDWLFPSAGVPLWLVNLAKEDLRLHFCALTSLERPPHADSLAPSHVPARARPGGEKKKHWLRQEMCVEIPFHWYIRWFLGQSFLHHLPFIQNVKVAVFL